MVSNNPNVHGFYNHIGLISAPWSLFSRPSIQLGALKAYVQNVFPDLEISCHHFFLTVAEAVGYPIYQTLSRETWLAESVYAALLYPDRYDAIAGFFAAQAKKTGNAAATNFPDLIRRVQIVTTDFIQKTDWTAMDLAGFSICLCQLTASLYFIQEIKRQAPQLPLIMGGSGIGGDTAGDLLAVFPQIDLIVIGEGERPLTRMIRHLRAGGRCDDLPPMAGIVRRKDGRLQASAGFCQLPSLENLPMPDFSDYFDLLASFPESKRFFPTLPAEISRGCWWQAAKQYKRNRPHPRGCAFCNLNLQWEGYRTKAAGQVVDEIDRLTDKHKLLSVAFTDNALPPKKSREIFTALGDKDKDFQLFAELRASTTHQLLAHLSKAGMTDVQIGIESLSSSLLKKMNKGTTAMDNMEIMKHCEALGIKNVANLILHFPGSDETDVSETMCGIQFARFFRPLRTVRFRLGMHSPVWEEPQNYGLTAVFNHPHLKKLFPPSLWRRVRFMIQDYRGDKTFQRRLWRPVVRAVEKWEQDYFQLHSDPYAEPILTLQDGRSFLILRERRIDGAPVNHRLEGTSRKIYLFCENRRRFEEIKERFSWLPEDKIRAFLYMMTSKGLIFEDHDRYLGLAIPIRRACR